MPPRTKTATTSRATKTPVKRGSAKANAIPDKPGRPCKVTPAAVHVGADGRITPNKYGPWIGRIVDDPRHSDMGLLARYADANHYVIVRCVDPLDAKGIHPGEDYAVLPRFIEFI